MIIQTEQDMLNYGEQLAKNLTPPAVIELVGDVGAGKTTLTRGLAKGLNIETPVTSPSFTISKRYAGEKADLVHYDFYRLDDPGIMAEDLAEAVSDAHTITVIEWGESVKDLLPTENHHKIEIKLNEDGSREIIS